MIFDQIIKLSRFPDEDQILKDEIDDFHQIYPKLKQEPPESYKRIPPFFKPVILIKWKEKKGILNLNFNTATQGRWSTSSAVTRGSARSILTKKEQGTIEQWWIRSMKFKTNWRIYYCYIWFLTSKDMYTNIINKLILMIKTKLK